MSRIVRRRWLAFAVAVGVLAFVLVALGTRRTPVPQPVGHVDGREVVLVRLSWSSAYLIRSRPAVLIDAGSEGDEEALDAALAHLGLRLDDIGAVVLTHGHADHAGLARRLQERGATIIAGRGDAAMLAAGRNPQLRPIGASATILARVVPDSMRSLVADVWVDDRLDLRPFGVAAEAVAVPGHTPGSLAVVAGATIFAGDLVRGGELGGTVDPHTAHEHYFHDDRDAARARLEALLRGGAERFLVGHGGPLDASTVAAMLRSSHP